MYTIVKGEVKLSLYTDDSYIENRKTRIPQLINKYIKITEHKFNIQKFTAFLYVSNQQLQFEF